MKKKKNITSRLSDALVLLLCIGGAAVSLWLFWTDLNSTLSKLNEKPIAKVTYKYKVSQRKFMDRLVWDRLQQNSDLYNGDTIRTADQAQATIYYENNTIELGPNSIIQIFSDKNGEASIDFGGGNLYVDSQAATSAMVLRSGSAAVTLEPGAALSASAAAESANLPRSLNLQLVSGTATYAGTEGAQKRELKGGTGITIDGTGETQIKPLTVLSPPASARFLKQRGTSLPVLFSWETGSLPEDSTIVLETSTDKNFAVLEEQIAFSRIKTITINMGSGTRYWRLYALNADGQSLNASLVSGRTLILDAPPPTPIVPAAADSFTYRTRLPSVRFMWNGNEQVSNYILEIADNQRMESPTIRQTLTQTSSITVLPKAGRWYWRVTPVYPGTLAAEGIPSSISFFNIIQSGTLNAPQLTAPEQNGFINTATNASGQNAQTVFSWKHDSEAVSYTVKIARNEALTEDAKEFQASDNWHTIVPESDGITNGRWYWSVNTTDSEGNSSPFAPARAFIAVDGEMIFQPVFPPDGYRAADSRTRDIRFTWKKNFDDPVRLHISASADFAKPVYDEIFSAAALGAEGTQLPQGTWYWRLVSVSPDGKIQYKTETRRFYVVPPIAAPLILAPAQSAKLAVNPVSYINANWLPAAGADYYQISVYEEKSETPVYQERRYGETDASIPVSNLKDGSYRLTVQAVAEETIASTRRTGLLSTRSFSLKKMYPALLVSPEDKTSYDGLNALLTPSSMEWSAQSPASKSEFILATNRDALPAKHGEAGGSGIVYRKENPPHTIELPPLKSGTYWWTVTASTEDDFDLSVTEPRSFTVLPVPHLAAPADLQPPAGTVLDVDYLLKSEHITLSWEPTAGSNQYELILYRADKNNPSSRTLILKTAVSNGNNSYTIEELAKLDEGAFIWTVEARRRSDQGEIIQNGITAQSSFAIELPSLTGIQLQNPGELYGN